MFFGSLHSSVIITSKIIVFHCLSFVRLEPTPKMSVDADFLAIETPQENEYTVLVLVESVEPNSLSRG